jgi:hypothetical protein
MKVLFAAWQTVDSVADLREIRKGNILSSPPLLSRVTRSSCLSLSSISMFHPSHSAMVSRSTYHSTRRKIRMHIPQARIGRLTLTSLGKSSPSKLVNVTSLLTYLLSRRAFSPKTKMIIVNTPHNPVGKVFTREELTKIAELAVEFNVMVMADEVVRLLFHPHFRRSAFLIHGQPFSTIICFMMARSMSGSLIYPACGTELSQSALRAVRIFLLLCFCDTIHKILL